MKKLVMLFKKSLEIKIAAGILFIILILCMVMGFNGMKLKREIERSIISEMIDLFKDSASDMKKADIRSLKKSSKNLTVKQNKKVAAVLRSLIDKEGVIYVSLLKEKEVIASMKRKKEFDNKFTGKIKKRLKGFTYPVYKVGKDKNHIYEINAPVLNAGGNNTELRIGFDIAQKYSSAVRVSSSVVTMAVMLLVLAGFLIFIF